MQGSRQTSRYRRVLPLFVFVASIVFSVLVGASLTAFHMPYQAPDSGVGRLVNDMDPGSDWRVLHILSAACACSHRVAEHLIERRPFLAGQERVLLAGQDRLLLQRLRDAGYLAEAVNGDGLAEHYGLAGAPWLIVVSPDGKIAYQGGYARDARAAEGFEDGNIWQQVRQGQRPSALPVFGCAIGRSLQRRMDPLALKYASN